MESPTSRTRDGELLLLATQASDDSGSHVLRLFFSAKKPSSTTLPGPNYLAMTGKNYSAWTHGRCWTRQAEASNSTSKSGSAKRSKMIESKPSTSRLSPPPGGSIVGIESLIRWRQEDGQLVAPADFLDVAQEAGLLPSLDIRMLEKATALGGTLARAGKPLMVSVNFLAVELSYSDLVDRVHMTLADSRMDPEHLLLEITETAVLRTDATLPVLWDLQNVGLNLPAAGEETEADAFQQTI